MSCRSLIIKEERYTQRNPVVYSGCTLRNPSLINMLTFFGGGKDG